MDEQEWIKLCDAVELVAKFCYPDEGDYRNTKNKVRGKIRTATKNGLLDRIPDGSSWKFNRHDFLQWAGNKWPVLRNCLSIPVVISGVSATLEVTGARARVDITPSDPRELRDLLKKCRDELDEAKVEIRRLKPFEEKWNAHKEEKKKLSEKLSQAASRKRGPRTKH